MHVLIWCKYQSMNKFYFISFLACQSYFSCVIESICWMINDNDMYNSYVFYFVKKVYSPSLYKSLKKKFSNYI